MKCWLNFRIGILVFSLLFMNAHAEEFKSLPLAEIHIDQCQLSLLSYSPLDLNPFKEKQIFSIWKKDLAQLAFDAFEEEATEIVLDPGYDQGEALLVVDKFNRILAVSGYFPDPNDLGRFYLRWHGVVPQLQKKGVSKWILDSVVSRIKALHPKVHTLVEATPDMPFQESVVAHFVQYGFKRTETIETHEWSQYPWREYELPLRHLKR